MDDRSLTTPCKESALPVAGTDIHARNRQQAYVANVLRYPASFLKVRAERSAGSSQ